MEVDIITQKDLREFKQEMLKEMRGLLEGKDGRTEPKEWLKSADVRKLLDISPGTLQNLRVNGSLPYKKIGGSMYYRRDDIRKMMEKTNHDE